MKTNQSSVRNPHWHGNRSLATASFGSFHPSIYLPIHKNIVPIITPLNENGLPILNESALRKYALHLEGLGNRHLFVLGETGEFRLLTNQQRLDFARAFVPIAKQLGLKVYVNATAEDFSKTWDNYRAFLDLNVDAVIFAPLWGKNRQLINSLKGGVDFLKGPPIILYNNPGITAGINLAYGDIRDVAPYIGALKDSSGDIQRSLFYRQCLNTSLEGAPKLYLGDEILAARHIHNPDFDGAVGSSGCVSNLLNRLYSQETETETVASIVSQFNGFVMSISFNRVKNVAGLKAILKAQGIIPYSGLCAGNRPIELTIREKETLEALVNNGRKWN